MFYFYCTSPFSFNHSGFVKLFLRTSKWDNTCKTENLIAGEIINEVNQIYLFSYAEKEISCQFSKGSLYMSFIH